MHIDRRKGLPVTNVEGRVALVTGCGRAISIGAAIARKLAANGMRVVVSDVAPAGFRGAHWKAPVNADWGGVESLANEIAHDGGVASWTLGDVSVEHDAVRMVEEARDRYGRLDILVNNAAAPHGADVGDLETVPLEAWDSVMAVNLRGVFLMSRAAVVPMKAQGWGRIINIASVAGKVGAPQRAAYSASKAGVLGFTRSLAIDMAPFGVTVNAVCPGAILTERVVSARAGLEQTDFEDGIRKAAELIPTRRFGTGDDVAACVAFIASEGASYITGEDLVVDGGGMPHQVAK
jgi:3-oxoacyl-[acyl-carrier protein] reductase